jgi:hypothetical protein
MLRHSVPNIGLAEGQVQAELVQATVWRYGSAHSQALTQVEASA